MNFLFLKSDRFRTLFMIMNRWEWEVGCRLPVAGKASELTHRSALRRMASEQSQGEFMGG